MAVVLAACASSPGLTASPSQVAPATASPAVASAATTIVIAPSPSPSTSPAGSAAACLVTRQTGLLPSDRLVDLVVSSTTTHDLLTFVFAPSVPGPGGPPRGTLEIADPPFSFAGSGQAIAMLGGQVVQVRFTAMTIASDSGVATYQGPTVLKPQLAALREAIQYDASEGIVGWYVGYDGSGCVTLASAGNEVTVAIAHPEAPAG